MMRVIKFLPFIVLIFFGGQYTFADSVYARHSATHCCMCGACYSYCWCGGQASCAKCHSDDGENILSPVSADNLKIDIRQDTQLQLLTGVQSESIGSVMTLVRASRLRGHFTLKLIDHVADFMMFKCRSLEL